MAKFEIEFPIENMSSSQTSLTTFHLFSSTGMPVLCVYVLCRVRAAFSKKLLENFVHTGT